MGLTVGYLYLLLLIHVPGAVAHALPWSHLPDREATVVGARLTSYGCLAFLAGVWMAKLGARNIRLDVRSVHPRFQKFCLIGGWISCFAFLPVIGRIPTLSALVDKGGMIWMAGVMVGLIKSLQWGRTRALLVWLLLLAVYPLVILVRDGFLSFGMNAAILCLAPLALVARTNWKAWSGIVVVTVVGMGLFATYISMRQELREIIWGGEEMDTRIAESSRILSDFRMLDAQNEETLKSVHDRLNQNHFVGLAYQRLSRGIVDFYRGRTVVEALMAIVPRALWPEKPVYGGSPKIIETMTGFKVAKGTSYGVGNVMEFYINFGIPSLVIGFLIIGFLLARLDAAAVAALAAGNLKGVLLRVVPSIALIQPDKSVVEMFGGAAAALTAAWVWCRLWEMFQPGREQAAKRSGPVGWPEPGNYSRRNLPDSEEKCAEQGGDWDVKEARKRDDFQF